MHNHAYTHTSAQGRRKMSAKWLAALETQRPDLASTSAEMAARGDDASATSSSSDSSSSSSGGSDSEEEKEENKEKRAKAEKEEGREEVHHNA